VRVYPHVCGGISSINTSASGIRGLSPRVRGHPYGLRTAARVMRSIPTCAGASVIAHRTGIRPEVYPHVCGGISHSRRTPSPPSGLSPRVRGHHTYIERLSGARRSIPTCAGASTPRGRSSGCGRVYPHVCGGIWCPSWANEHARGLSPRVRGHREIDVVEVG